MFGFDDFETQVQVDETLPFNALSEDEVEEFHHWLDLLSFGRIEDLEARGE